MHLLPPIRAIMVRQSPNYINFARKGTYHLGMIMVSTSILISMRGPCISLCSKPQKLAVFRSFRLLAWHIHSHVIEKFMAPSILVDCFLQAKISVPSNITWDIKKEFIWFLLVKYVMDCREKVNVQTACMVKKEANCNWKPCCLRSSVLLVWYYIYNACVHREYN